MVHLGVLVADLLEMVHGGADVVGAHEQGVELLKMATGRTSLEGKGRMRDNAGVCDIAVAQS